MMMNLLLALSVGQKIGLGIGLWLALLACICVLFRRRRWEMERGRDKGARVEVDWAEFRRQIANSTEETVGVAAFLAQNTSAPEPPREAVMNAQGGQLNLRSGRSALQDWVMELPIMQQSVLIAAVRGPDGIRKDHPVKVLCRWLRRSFLVSAFEGRGLLDPYEEGGGSFTGPCCSGEIMTIDDALDAYLRTVDELPHHFQLHFMHAAQILGYKHPYPPHRAWWNRAYLALVNDAHLFPEPLEAMDKRLSDNEAEWRAREEVTAL